MRDYRVARERMVREELEERGVRDRRVLDAMRRVPRHLFVPAALRPQAYRACALPIGYDQTISQPFIVGLMTTLLELGGGERVLEVGTGSGYQAALLGLLARRVVSVERVVPLARRAALALAEAGIANVAVQAADGILGWPPEAPYDAVMVTACAAEPPMELLDQLADGGRLLVPLAEGGEQLLYRYRRVEGELSLERSVPCRFVAMRTGLEGAEQHA